MSLLTQFWCDLSDEAADGEKGMKAATKGWEDHNCQCIHDVLSRLPIDGSLMVGDDHNAMFNG